jgi:phage terminase Nu1 subunit (DNA packaging protein)
MQIVRDLLGDEFATVPAERRANKTSAARWFGVSRATFEKWISRGCPCIIQGDNWMFDLREVAKWAYSPPSSDDGDDDEFDPEQLPPNERMQWYKGSRERLKYMEEAGKLVKISEYERELSAALKIVAISLETLPDVIERNGKLPAESIAAVQKICDRVRDDMYRHLAEMAKASGESSDRVDTSSVDELEYAAPHNETRDVTEYE